MVSEYISRDEVIKAIMDVCKRIPTFAIYGKMIIEALPSLHLKIVNCADCKHWKSGNGTFGQCYYEHYDCDIGRYTTKMETHREDYCSFGEV